MSKAFTLIELLVVMVIIAIFAALLPPARPGQKPKQWPASACVTSSNSKLPGKTIWRIVAKCFPKIVISMMEVLGSLPPPRLVGNRLCPYQSDGQHKGSPSVNLELEN